jgi:hypothetical protein
VSIERPGAHGSHTVELSLSGQGLTASVSGSGSREPAFHSSERGTSSQAEVRSALRARADAAREKELAIKARADAARAKVREQMNRNKAVEAERRRAAREELDD